MKTSVSARSLTTVRRFLLSIIVAFAVAALAHTPAIAVTITIQQVSSTTRAGITIPVLIINRSAENAVATVILFTGGNGQLHLLTNWQGQNLSTYETGCTSITHCFNFLVRSRNRFAHHNFNVVLMDVPTDKPNGYSHTSVSGDRESQDHLNDINDVINYLQQNVSTVPAWLVGTSRGSTSAAFGGTLSASNPQPSGVVLTASNVINTDGDNVLGLNLGNIVVPAMLVSHYLDSCYPASGVNEIAAQLQPLADHYRDFRGLVVPLDPAVVTVDPSDQCNASGYHGFSGYEAVVVGEIAAFIKHHLNHP